jgi:hypothetical protein
MGGRGSSPAGAGPGAARGDLEGLDPVGATHQPVGLAGVALLLGRFVVQVVGLRRVGRVVSEHMWGPQIFGVWIPPSTRSSPPGGAGRSRAVDGAVDGSAIDLWIEAVVCRSALALGLPCPGLGPAPGVDECRAGPCDKREARATVPRGHTRAPQLTAAASTLMDHHNLTRRRGSLGAAQMLGSICIADYLIAALFERGVGHVFGVPGDYSLKLCERLTTGPLQLVTTCDEQGAGFAADAYARLRGLGAVCVTYGSAGSSWPTPPPRRSRSGPPSWSSAARPGWTSSAVTRCCITRSATTRPSIGCFVS